LLLPPNGTLSQALESALSSPSGIGVAVDDAGRFAGGVLAADVLAAVDARRRG
jgi:osmoprotectant transport system ATP-binding protein